MGSQLVENREEMYITSDCGKTWRQVGCPPPPPDPSLSGWAHGALQPPAVPVAIAG